MLRWGDIAIKVTFASGWQVCPHTYTNGFAIPTIWIILNLPVGTSGKHASTCIIQVRCSPFQSHLVLRISTSKYLQFGCSSYVWFVAATTLPAKKTETRPSTWNWEAEDDESEEEPTDDEEWLGLAEAFGMCVSPPHQHQLHFLASFRSFPAMDKYDFGVENPESTNLYVIYPEAPDLQMLSKVPPPYRPQFQYSSHPWMLKEWFAIPEVNFYCYG